MDSIRNIDDLKNKVIKFRDDRNWLKFHSIKDLVLGLGIECSELQELFLWKQDDEIKEFLASKKGQKKVKEELADIFTFLLYLSDVIKIDLSDALIMKLKINQKRYPIEKSFNLNKKYK